MLFGPFGKYLKHGADMISTNLPCIYMVGCSEFLYAVNVDLDNFGYSSVTKCLLSC